MKTASAMAAGQSATVAKMSHEQFVTTAITKLRAAKNAKKGTDYKGVHVVFDGLNAAIEQYYGLEKGSARGVMDALVKKGTIAVIPCRGGAQAYLAADAPERKDNKAASALATILG